MAVPCMQWVVSLITVAIALGVACRADAQPSGRDRAPAEASSAAPSVPSDEALLEAHEAARNGDRDLLASLAPRIAGHLLETYYEYWKVSLQARTGEDDAAAVRAFFERYPGTYLADRLRADWLLALGARGNCASRSGIAMTCRSAAMRR